MAKYDLTGAEKDFEDGNLTEQQKIIVKKNYLGSDNSNSKTRDEIAKIIHVKKDRLQPFFKYLSDNPEYKDEHKEHLPVRVRKNKYEVKDIQKDYSKGMTVQQLQKKYHTSNEKMVQITHSFNDNVKVKHKKQIIKHEFHKGNYDEFVKKYIKNRNSNLICRIRLKSTVKIMKYPDQRNSHEHTTKFLTFNVKSAGDVEKVRESIEKNYGNIILENGDIMCKDYTHNRLVPFTYVSMAF